MLLSILWDLTTCIVALGILITVHEFGHFWVARLCGVHVERFSIGFGKSIWQYTDHHGSEFAIALIPLGGYVKMLNKPGEAAITKACHYAFDNKTIGQRAAIIAAGPIANFIFAIFAYWLVFIIGVPGIRPVVEIEEITTNPVSSSTLSSGIELKEIDDIKSSNWNIIRLQLINKISNTQAIVSVLPFDFSQRKGKVFSFQHWFFEHKKEDPIAMLKIRPCRSQIETMLAGVHDRCVVEKAVGLELGDRRIVKTNDQMLTRWIIFVNLARDNLNKLSMLKVERQGGPLPWILISDIKARDGKTKEVSGVMPKVPLSYKYEITRQYGPFSAIVKATVKTWKLMKLTIDMLGKLITGDVKLSNLSGPIAIAKGAGISAEFGMIHYLMFLALISINFGIINLFPLPVLDGGYLLFLAIEKLKGGPISKRIQNISYHISSIFLVLLMGLALFNDFSRL